MIKRHADEDALFYLVGGGIASLAAAAFLIRDGGVKGSHIRILEESTQFGGSLDAGGNATDGYTMRGAQDVREQIPLYVRPLRFDSDPRR
jgi:oleate hydratase